MVERGRWGQSAMGICAFFICETYSVHWLSRNICSIEGEGGVSLPWVHVHFAICEAYLLWLCCIELWWIGGGILDLGICAFCYI